MRELRDELEVEGHVVMYTTKTKSDWIKQAKEALSNAEKYGASTPNQMNNEDRGKLREALQSLGQRVDF